MAWNPEKYNQFKDIRYAPFFDLTAMISAEGLKNCVDLGCGTGEQTAVLCEKFGNAYFLGIDFSKEMLSGSERYARDGLRFENASIEAFLRDDSTWDLIFSNAALQWTDDHEELFPALISKLNSQGQLAVQMPVQGDNLLNKLLLELARERPYADYLKGYVRRSPVLSMDAYARMMFEGGLTNLQIVQKVYPIVADNAAMLFDFISGSALIPYMERMSAGQREVFAIEFKNRIELAFLRFPALYAFKRLLLYGRKDK